VTLYALSFGVLLLLGGRLSDIFGRNITATPASPLRCWTSACKSAARSAPRYCPLWPLRPPPMPNQVGHTAAEAVVHGYHVAFWTTAAVLLAGAILFPSGGQELAGPPLVDSVDGKD
jgi:hypothetical protein